jgi:hypothetical protein
MRRGGGRQYSTAPFEHVVPIEHFLKQQRDIDRAQGEMKAAINALRIRRVKAGKSSGGVSSRRKSS